MTCLRTRECKLACENGIFLYKKWLHGPQGDIGLIIIVTNVRTATWIGTQNCFSPGSNPNINQSDQNKGTSSSVPFLGKTIKC